jgi:aryl-phospho-beta-D-glucosidase BglC (GH1 family)
MASWHANLVRIALNQDFWLANATLHDPNYQSTVDTAVRNAEAAGLDVMLDLHWSDAGNLGVTVSGKQQNSATNSNQQQMADVNSKEFWAEVAAKYAGDGHVFFELYNEPNTVGWSIWLNGGTVSTSGTGGATTFTVVGMQDLYDTVRQTGANNLVVIGGLNWAFDLSGVANNPVKGFNILYATHPYDTPDRGEGSWPTSFGYLAANDIAPVIATEFGDGRTGCTGKWDSDLVGFSAKYKISWTAWAWWVGGCSFPALLSDWKYTPTSTSDPTVPGAGEVIKAALANDPPVVPRTGADGGDAASADGPAPETSALDASDSSLALDGSPVDDATSSDGAEDAPDAGTTLDDAPGTDGSDAMASQD